MVDPSDLFVRVFVPETEIGKSGSARLRRSSPIPARPVPGTVTHIASQAEFTPNNVQTKEQRVKLVYEVRVRVPDDSGTLKSGMPVEVTFDLP